MEDRDIEITTKVKLSDILKGSDSDKVGGIPVVFALFMMIMCILGIVVISQQGHQSPSQTNTVIVK